jgi:hypothetical protein
MKTHRNQTLVPLIGVTVELANASPMTVPIVAEMERVTVGAIPVTVETATVTA